MYFAENEILRSRMTMFCLISIEYGGIKKWRL